MINKPLVSVEWLKENFENPALVLLDASTSVHEEKEDQRIIATSLSADMKADFSDTSSDFPNAFPSIELFENSCKKLGISNDSLIIIYDDKGVFTSPRLWWLFKTFGHKQVAVLDGGLPAWLDEGGLTTLDYAEAAVQGSFKSQLDASVVWSYENVVDNISSNNQLLLDARSAGRFSGESPEPRASLKSGHIPNSLSLPYTEVLNDVKFKSEVELKTLFDDLLDREDDLVFSCGSGITACIILLAAELVLDNRKSVFDGSWTEWASRQGLFT